MSVADSPNTAAAAVVRDRMAFLHTRWWLAVEFSLLFVALPLTLNALPFPSQMLFPLLWAAAVACTIYLFKSERFDRAAFWNWKKMLSASRWIVPRFVLLAGLLTAALLVFLPPVPYVEPTGGFEELRERDRMEWALLGFVRWRPEFFAVVMTVYPIFSVIPQNIVYRVFLFHRYRPLLGEGWVMVLVGAGAFGLGHVMFANWVAPFLTAVGGVFMMDTYRRTRSGAASWLEHTLFGDFIWFIGIGRLFLYISS